MFETHKLTYKKMVAKDFPAKTASYCIPSFTLELKIQTYLFFAAETWFFDINHQHSTRVFFSRYIYKCAGDFFVTQNTNMFCVYLSELPTPGTQYSSFVWDSCLILVVPNGTSPTRKDMLFGLWFRSP